MRTLDRYLGINFIQGLLLVILVLVSLFSFLELVIQLDDVGKGNYQALEAFVFVGLTLPKRIIDMLPISALLGSIIGLGMLAERGELLAMRAAGLSVSRICVSVLAAAGLLMVASAALTQFVVPQLEQYAHGRRSLAVSGSSGITLTQQGFWARHGSSFIRVGIILSGGLAADVDIYERNQDGLLRAFIHAGEADIHQDGRWTLKDIYKKVIEEQGISTEYLPSLTIDSFFNKDQVSVFELPPESLSPSHLYLYIKALRERGQNVDNYNLALWQKLVMPLTTAAMVLLALPFVFGPPRGRTVGFRITMGAMVGIGFYLANQIIGYLGLLFELPAPLTTLTPLALILGIAIWRLRQAP
ncbi:MAG: LPS export ABC transporter permease LptG [Deltaproteobacteria bacterium]|nr:MAG: LPS export ABC transporter permease LptG [Deltaproteobacteria bacterium]